MIPSGMFQFETLLASELIRKRNIDSNPKLGRHLKNKAEVVQSRGKAALGGLLLRHLAAEFDFDEATGVAFDGLMILNFRLVGNSMTQLSSYGSSYLTAA